MNKLRMIREKTGRTMTDVAIAARVATSNVSLIERGARPSRPVAQRLADVLGVDPAKIWPEFETFRPW